MKALVIFLTLFAVNTYAANEVKIAVLTEDPPSISPFDAAGPDAFVVVNAVFDSLMSVDLTGNLEFNLAEKYEQLSPSVHRLTLRKGVKFHNGEDLTAESVKATFDMHLDPAVKSSRRYIFASIKSVRVEDKYRVIFETDGPDNLFLNRLVLFSGILPESLIKNGGREKVKNILIGSGPFEFVDWSPGKRIRLKKNPHYWKPGLPKADVIDFEILGRDQWMKALLSGTVDVVPSFPGKDARFLAPNPKIKLLKKIVNASHWLLINNQKKPLSNSKVRTAINYALNREDLVEYAAYGNGKVAGALRFTHESTFDEKNDSYPFNPSRAKALLAEAGYKNGITLHGWVTDVSETVAHMIKKQLSLVNIRLEYEVISAQNYARKFQMYKVNHKSVPKDLDFIINIIGNPLGHVGFHVLCLLQTDGIQSITSDIKLDNFVDGFIKADTKSESDSKLKQLIKYVRDESLIVPTYQIKEIVAFRSDVELSDFSNDGNFIGQMIANIWKKSSK
ncbi:MAG: ABC transporter substrate-binding protein [Bacteriovoracia bacterium]